MYSAATAFLGFRPNSGEGKVMGLAPYGRDSFAAAFDRILTLRPEGGIALDTSLLDYHLARAGSFSAATRRTFGEPRVAESAIARRDEDLACSVQAALERAALHIAGHLHRETGLDALCLAGGVALNATMNRRLLECSPFRRVFVQPAAGDPGTALGAALCASPASEPREPARMAHAFWGPAATEDEIASVFRQRDLEATRPDDISAAVASLLARGLVVGWFQGRMEWGPRALGARSILADPRRAEMKDILNNRVKHREAFRPFAPAVLAEAAEEYFVPPTESEFMTQVVPVKSQAQAQIPAGVHVDGTARLQTVRREVNPRSTRSSSTSAGSPACLWSSTHRSTSGGSRSCAVRGGRHLLPQHGHGRPGDRRLPLGQAARGRPLRATPVPDARRNRTYGRFRGLGGELPRPARAARSGDRGVVGR